MSKSVDSVHSCLAEHGVSAEIRAIRNSSRTAMAAACEIGCELNQIVNSMVNSGNQANRIFMFLTAGNKQISTVLAKEPAGKPIDQADPVTVRTKTGLGIGGVAPIAHCRETRKFIDRTLLQFQEVWATAGTPNHVFNINPDDLVSVFGSQLADFVE